MRKFVIIAFTTGALALGGCATFQADLARIQTDYTLITTATVPASTAAIAVSSFQVIEAASTEYFRYCRANPGTSACAPGTVMSPGPLRLAIRYVRQGRSARDQIKAAGKSGQLISSTVYNLLTQAIAALPNYISANGVPGQ